MKCILNILLIFLSCSVLALPVTAMVPDLPATEEMQLMSCCTTENHDCDMAAESEHHSHSQNEQHDCTDTHCPMKCCHTPVLSIKIISEYQSENPENLWLKNAKTSSGYYLSPIISDFINNIWNPPKYIS